MASTAQECVEISNAASMLADCIVNEQMVQTFRFIMNVDESEDERRAYAAEFINKLVSKLLHVDMHDAETDDRFMPVQSAKDFMLLYVLDGSNHPELLEMMNVTVPSAARKESACDAFLSEFTALRRAEISVRTGGARAESTISAQEDQEAAAFVFQDQDQDQDQEEEFLDPQDHNDDDDALIERIRQKLSVPPAVYNRALEISKRVPPVNMVNVTKTLWKSIYSLFGEKNQSLLTKTENMKFNLMYAHAVTVLLRSDGKTLLDLCEKFAATPKCIPAAKVQDATKFAEYMWAKLVMDCDSHLQGMERIKNLSEVPAADHSAYCAMLSLFRGRV